MQRHSRARNFYEDLSQEELVNKMAQILWYARPGEKRSWKNVGNNEKTVYRCVAKMFIGETQFRVNSTRNRLALERRGNQNGERQVSDPTGILTDFEELDEDKILGIKRAR